ncbi:MAG TPA: hypothetical protein VH351_01395 [Bryobacteraceae bacterium]|jgi:hypothetical protein|nr:hypothetical protein [Bryobacteraceae bacterium]
MLPNELTAERFNGYPLEARARAVQHLTMFRQLPLSFLPLLLRELIAYDWRFPAERKDLDRQLAFLREHSETEIQSLMAPFVKITVAPELAQMDWINQPVQFSERLTAHLWASHQIDAFREASVKYIEIVNAGKKDEPLPMPRLAMVLVGEKAQGTQYRLFRNLRAHGVHYTNVLPEGGAAVFFDALRARAAEHPAPFAHWYIDGGDLAVRDDSLACVSYRALRPVCDALIARMTKVMQPGGGGPELLRTQLAAMKPDDVGLSSGKGGPVLSRFELSLLTEGSGTQIYSTTFVQWAAREALRRAQPYTLVARFAPRRQEAPIGAPDADKVPFDPEGSLVDADMGAYYTWLNQQRLPGAEQSRFIAWFEGHNEALAIGPSLQAGTENGKPTALRDILAQVG